MSFKKITIYTIIVIFLYFCIGFNSLFFLENKEAQAISWGNGYLYRKQISVDNTKVSGNVDLSNFPVLINLTDSDLIATSSGGNVWNENGYDIVFMPESSTSTILDFEIEKYSSSTGELIAWVEVPALYYGTNTILYIYYGNSNISSSQEDVNNVWDSNFKGVWHLDDDLLGTVSDSTSNDNNGLSYGSISTSNQVNGKIGGSIDFNGIDDYINLGSSSSLDLTSAITIELWAAGTSPNISFETRRTSSEIESPLMQVVGDEVYYTWTENSVNKYIWTGKMNINSSGFNATRRVSSALTREFLDFQVTSDKIHYVWTEDDGSYKQIWTGSMDKNGANWSANKRTNASLNQAGPKLQVANNTIYYVFYDDPIGISSDIWTATMNINGSSWSANNRTDDSKNRKKANPNMQVVSSKIYYAWSEYDDDIEYYQIATGDMNINGTSFSYATKTADSMIDYGEVDLRVDDGEIYYVWVEDDYFQSSGTNTQIWTGSQSINGTNWSVDKKTTGVDFWHYNPTLNLSGNKINYVWYDMDGSSNYRLRTASVSKNGSAWNMGRSGTGSQTNPSFQVVGAKTYYFMVDSAGNNLITGKVGSNILNKGDFYGLGVVSTTAKAFINAGVDTLKYNASSTSYLAGGVATSSISSAWKHLVLTYDKLNVKLYVDGSLINSDSFSQDISTSTFNLILGDNWDGQVDEVRISDNARSADWVATAYNNQNSPASFYNMGSQEQENFLPQASSVSVNSGADAVTLTEGTTTAVTCTANVSDSNGFSDITTVEAKFYRSGVGEGASDDYDNHYTLSGPRMTYCSGSGVSGSCTFIFQIYYFAEPTDSGTYGSQNWTCQVEPSDSDGTGISSSYVTEVDTLESLEVSNIDYGTILANSVSVGDNIATVTNSGNTEIDIKISGNNVNCERGSISVTNQEYGLSSFTHGNGIDLADVLVDLNVALPKPNDRTPLIKDLIYWQLNTYAGLAGSCSSSINIITRVPMSSGD